MSKIALQADVWYNKPINIVAPAVLATPRGWTNLIRRFVVDTIPHSAQESNIPEKQCTGPCGRMLPATFKFFWYQEKGILRSECRDCQRARKPKRKLYDPIESLFPQQSPVNLAYLAGIIDGEGCIQVWRDHRNNTHMPRIDVEMTHSQTIDWIRAMFPGVSNKPITRSNPRHATTYDWCVMGRKALNVLQQVLPYLKGKRREAELLLGFPYLESRAGSHLRLPEEITIERERIRFALKQAKREGKERHE